jgi:hypothetical protein
MYPAIVAILSTIVGEFHQSPEVDLFSDLPLLDLGGGFKQQLPVIAFRLK